MTKLDEVINITQEECAEVIEALSKCRRFGLDNSHKSGKTQRENLTEEVGDLLAMIDLLADYAELDWNSINKAKEGKYDKLKVWSNIFG